MITQPSKAGKMLAQNIAYHRKRQKQVCVFGKYRWHLKQSNNSDVGCECVFDGNRWGIVEAITDDGTYIVVDQSGGEHGLARDRIDDISRLAK